jgi:threonine dehydratase
MANECAFRKGSGWHLGCPCGIVGRRPEIEPLRVTIADIEAARRVIQGAVLRTPMLPAPRLSALTGSQVYVKYENLQVTNSFKDRGALVKLASLSEAERKRGVIAMSAGNHAQAVAYHAARLGIPATIVMPVTTPFVKVAATRSHGAEVVLHGESVAEAEQRCEQLRAARGLTLVHPYDDAKIIAGQGTIALEMLEEVPDLDALVIPIGGGGLISGNAIAAKARDPKIEIVGAEAALYPSVWNELTGEHLPIGGPTLAEGIAVKNVG